MRLAFILLFAAATLLGSCHGQSTQKEAAADAMSADGFFSTPTLDAERVRKVLPLRGSEDASALLRYSPPPVPAARPESATLYYANARFDWTLPLPLHSPLSQQQLRRVFDRQWQQAHDQPTVYGRSAQTSRWTYALGGNGADSVFTALALSWKLYDNRALKPHCYSAVELQALQRATATLAPRLGAQSGLPNLPAPQAALASAELGRFVTANDQPVIIVLQADKVFEGRAAWDALLSVGLHWGDEDLFYWNNPVPAAGGDYLFAVSTSTAPGYFLPEAVAAGRLNPADLVFSFSVARTVAPAQVLASMLRAATYCQRRLGGRLLNAAGQPFSLTAERQKCRLVEANLRARRLRAGVGDALYLF